MTPERLGKYEIRGPLGKGAMGTVYIGWDPIISREVAIKTVRLPDAGDIDAQEELARFKREAQAAGRLTHPNIVGIFDYGETDDLAFIVMEFVDGKTLKSILDADERLAVPAVARIMGDLLSGLQYSHERGVVHRDIKPANVMMVGGGDGQAKIADFGIARIESSNLTQAGTIMGTPAYMSPEQFMGQTVDSRTDIYSAGVLLFQLLTGDRPFEGSMATIMHKALNTQPPKPSELSVTAPVALDAVVARAMARRPDDRFATAAAFADAIRAALAAPQPSRADLDGDATVVQTAPRPADRAEPPGTERQRARSKAPLLAGVAFIALAAIGAGGAWWFGMFAPPAQGVTPARPPPLATTTQGNTEVVTVTPPVAPTPAMPPLASADPPRTETPPSKPAPTPRADVTQVVPATTDPPASRPAEVLPRTEPPAPSPAQPDPAAAAPRPNGRLNVAGVTLEPATTAPPPAVAGPSRPEAASPLPPASISPPPVAEAPAAVPAAPAIVAPSALTPTVAPSAPTPTVAPSAPTPTVAPSAPTPIVSLPSSPTPPIEGPGAAQAEAGLPRLPTTRSPEPPPNTPVAAAAITPDALRRAVAAAAQGADCAVLRGDVSGAGTLSVQGVIGSGEPLQTTMGQIRDVAPTAPLDWTVREANGPYCGALNLVRAYARPFGSASGGIDVGLRNGVIDLVADDPIDIRTTMAGFPAYLQIDYFSSDGSVAHLRTSAQGSPSLPARSTQSFVAGAAAPPFGTDLIVAVASSAPLFPKGRTLSDSADAYLRELRTALDGAKQRRNEVAAGVAIVHTSPKT